MKWIWVFGIILWLILGILNFIKPTKAYVVLSTGLIIYSYIMFIKEKKNQWG